MFNSLKEKLKNWIGSNTEEEQAPKESKEKKTQKKTKAKKEAPKKTPQKNPEKEVIKESKKPSKKELPKQTEEKTVETVTKEKLAESKEKGKAEEKHEEKKSFFQRFTRKEDPVPPPVEEEIQKPAEELQEKKSFFSRFTSELTQDKFEELFSELEMILLQNNVAYEAVEAIKKSLEEKLIGKNAKDIELSNELREAINSILINPPDFIQKIKDSLQTKKPYVILFAGINGAGKTTSLAKIANLLKKNKISTCFAAADTFRAASIEQLQQHADALDVPLIKKKYGTDPASVGFEAIAYAKKHNIDVVLIDTAGRLQNKDSLMREIEKIVRVTNPNMRIFTGESITGNDCTEQAKAFNEAIGITGIILSKADVDEKGGTAISVSEVTGKPIYFLGTGQTYNDLEVFNKDKVIEKLGL